METMLSLYDYLGKRAGSELGKAVAQAAKQRNIKPSSKTITNPKYSGTILMYPKSFLDEYFKFPRHNLFAGLRWVINGFC